MHFLFSFIFYVGMLVLFGYINGTYILPFLVGYPEELETEGDWLKLFLAMGVVSLASALMAYSITKLLFGSFY